MGNSNTPPGQCVPPGNPVLGPQQSGIGCIAVYDTTGGARLKNSDVGIDASNNLSVPGSVLARRGIVIGETEEAYLLPCTDGLAGQRLTTDGQGLVSWATPPGDGDMVGPEFSTNTAIPRFNGTSGKLLQNSNVVIDGADNLSTSGSISAGSVSTPTVAADDVATTNVAAENVIVGGVDGFTLPSVDGVAGQVLSTDGAGIAQWSTPATGDVQGPASSITWAVPRFGDTTGKILHTTNVIIDGENDIHVPGEITVGTGATSYTLPNTDGEKDQFLSTNGAGVLSWTNAVVSEGMSTHTAVPCFSGTTGTQIASSAITLGNEGNDIDIPGDAKVKGKAKFGNDATNNDYTFPDTRGTVGQILQIDANGILQWVSPAVLLNDASTTESGTATISGEGTCEYKKQNNLVFVSANFTYEEPLTNSIEYECDEQQCIIKLPHPAGSDCTFPVFVARTADANCAAPNEVSFIIIKKSCRCATINVYLNPGDTVRTSFHYIM